jgi:hypothetical protein
MASSSTELKTITLTAQAAYLISEGFDAPDVVFDGSRASFIFTDINHTIDRYISDYDTGRATGNIILFFNAYQALLRRIKDGR